MKSQVFGTKAETLERLGGELRLSKILPQVRFTVQHWKEDQGKCLKRTRDHFKEGVTQVIVRSSAASEDSLKHSNAGRYTSKLGVSLLDDRELARAVDSVIRSYDDSYLLFEEQIFIQPMLKNVKMSGVIFTRDLDSHAPYYVINFDNTSKSTDSVTSGRTNDLRTVVLFRGVQSRQLFLRPVLQAVQEIEQCLGSELLDIEFATDSEGVVYIFQVRPIANSKNFSMPDTGRTGHFLEKIAKKVIKSNEAHPYLYGKGTLLGVMPDWNPAEMLGVKPRPLALSLYKDLITDRTWAYQRHNYGYRNLRSFPLMLTLLGHPYIDVRVSFNSFIPVGLNEELSSKLCDYYLKKLENNPASHDKVEFDIVLSCYFFNIDERLADLQKNEFSKIETDHVKEALLQLTNDILGPGDTVFTEDLKKIEELKKRQEKVLGSSLPAITKIYWLIEDCRRYGTLPFAGIARAAFISVQMLNSMVASKIISEEELAEFMRSMNTVARCMGRDHQTLSREEFLKQYGHLRPGTYDILLPSYSEAYDIYFGDEAAKDLSDKPASLALSKSFYQRIDQALKINNIALNAKELTDFFQKAIQGREYSKFVFSRSVSEILKQVKELAGRYELTVEDMSFVNIGTILELYATLDHRELRDVLKEDIDRNRAFYEDSKSIRLPCLIKNISDIYEFELEEGRPNFVTLKRARGEAVTELKMKTTPLKNKIVLIQSADPGYDWLFARNIAGLITMYGGANSHMAIRAAELGIPAVIGAGKKYFAQWSQAKALEIDSENKQVIIIR